MPESFLDQYSQIFLTSINSIWIREPIVYLDQSPTGTQIWERIRRGPEL